MNERKWNRKAQNRNISGNPPLSWSHPSAEIRHLCHGIKPYENGESVKNDGAPIDYSAHIFGMGQTLATKADTLHGARSFLVRHPFEFVSSWKYAGAEFATKLHNQHIDPQA